MECAGHTCGHLKSEVGIERGAVGAAKMRWDFAKSLIMTEFSACDKTKWPTLV